MNTVKLQQEQQIEVINSAVSLLRERIMGKVLKIDTITQEFLATDPSNRETEFGITALSVSRAIEEGVRWLMSLQRPHIEKPTISETLSVSLGEKVRRLYNSVHKERVPLPPRFAMAIRQRMSENDWEIETLEHRTLSQLREYFKTDDMETKRQRLENVQESLFQIHTLSEKNRDDDAAYDLSSLAADSDEDEDDQEKKFQPGDIFSTAGGLDMNEQVTDEDFRLEMEIVIPLSETERELHCCVSPEIAKELQIFGEIFTWYAYGEEWQRELFDIKKDAPKDYLNMLEFMLKRKLIIYSSAEQTLEHEGSKQLKKPVGVKMYQKIRDSLPELREEIDTLWGTVEKEKKSKTHKNAATTPTGTLSILEGSFSALRNKYRKALGLFLEIENYREVEKLRNSLIKKHADIVSHCLKNNLKSTLIGTSLPEVTTTTNNDSEIPTVDDYLEQPNYFETFPSAVLALKSESEQILEMACHIEPDASFGYDSGDEPIRFVYLENDGTESTSIEKMELIESVLSSILERKMSLYFHATHWLEDNESEEVDYYRYTLEKEIHNMQESLDMLTRRIRWDHDTKQKPLELQIEIDCLSQRRNNYLGEFAREDRGEKSQDFERMILTLTDALASRNKELSQMNPREEKPHSNVLSEPLSPCEGGLVRYTPIPLRKNESILFGRTIPYFAKKQKETPDHAWEKEKMKAIHHLERKMMIYFFAIKKIYDLDKEIFSADESDSKNLILERDLIEEKSSGLHDEILDLIEKITELNQYSMEQSEHETEEDKIQKLIHKATSLHAELDGIIAQSDNGFAQKVEYYWHTLQRHVLRFRSRLLIATEKGLLASIKQIQAEFDDEMHFIILDMQKTLGELQASRKTTEKMVNTVTIIRRELFGNKDI